MPAGRMRRRLRFETRKTNPDGAGNIQTTGWNMQFTFSARVRPLKGGEEVTAARLQGVQPVIITVRASSETRQIDSTWRAYDAENGIAYDIKSVANTDEKNANLDIMATLGGPDAQGADT
jgi:head-tail adaptor